MPLGGSNDPPTALTPDQIKYLKQAAEHIDYSLDEIAAEQDNIKALLDNCKAQGLHSATLRKAVVARRKRRNDPDAVALAEDRLEAYEAAIQ
jgi:uncharacterized protein (UPF0335 family)